MSPSTPPEQTYVYSRYSCKTMIINMSGTEWEQQLGGCACLNLCARARVGHATPITNAQVRSAQRLCLAVGGDRNTPSISLESCTCSSTKTPSSTDIRRAPPEPVPAAPQNAPQREALPSPRSGSLGPLGPVNGVPYTEITRRGSDAPNGRGGLLTWPRSTRRGPARTRQGSDAPTTVAGRCTSRERHPASYTTPSRTFTRRNGEVHQVTTVTVSCLLQGTEHPELRTGPRTPLS